MKKILIKSAKFLVSAILIALLVLKVNWKEVFGYVESISIGSLILYVLFLIIGIVISSYKWMLIARQKNFNFPLKTYFQLYLTGGFINNFLPSFIGGDAYRAFQIGKYKNEYASAATTVVVDRITGLLGAMFLTIITGAINWKIIYGNKIIFLVYLIILVALISVGVLFALRRHKIWKRLSEFLPNKVVEILGTFQTYGETKKLLYILLFSFIYNIVGLAVINYVLFVAMGVEISILNYLSVIFLISIVSSIPISINNIGVKEWAYVTFFGIFGIGAPALVAVALVSRVVQMLVSFTALPFYLRNK